MEWVKICGSRLEKHLTNHWVRLFIPDGKISLDNPWVCTYHMGDFAKRIPSHARKFYRGNGVNGGADSHDE